MKIHDFQGNAIVNLICNMSVSAIENVCTAGVDVYLELTLLHSQLTASDYDF